MPGNAPETWEQRCAEEHNRLRPLTTSAPDCVAVALGGRRWRLDAPGATSCLVDTDTMRGVLAALRSQAAALS
jgi:hypothetical protein